MKRLQIMIEPEIDAVLEQRAQVLGTSKAELIRRAVRKDVKPLPPIEEDPLWDLVGMSDAEPVEDIDAVIYDRKSSQDPGG